MAYTELTNAMVDLNSPIDSQLMTYIRDNLNYLKNAIDGIEESYTGTINNAMGGLPNYVDIQLQDRTFFPTFGVQGNPTVTPRISGVPDIISGNGCRFALTNWHTNDVTCYVGYRYMPNPSVSINSNPNFDRILDASIDQDSPLNDSLFTQIKKCFDRLKDDLDGTTNSQSGARGSGTNQIIMNDRSFFPTIGGNHNGSDIDEIATEIIGDSAVTSGYTPGQFNYIINSDWTTYYVGWTYLNAPDGTTDIWSALWTSISDAMIGIEGGLNTTLFTAIRDNIEYLKRRFKSSGEYYNSYAGTLTAGNAVTITMNDRSFMPRFGKNTYIRMECIPNTTTGTTGQIRLKNYDLSVSHDYYLGWRYLSGS